MQVDDLSREVTQALVLSSGGLRVTSGEMVSSSCRRQQSLLSSVRFRSDGTWARPQPMGTC